ncbi:type V CRISPR-associated protein Cas12k, partial [Leptolyngbya sp. FACHB-541]|uniref:type V CRISPR-associated protein Cas12k n=1 Tax=Leptolyngbya sp. FACHB-541 TaxID=2692810 RepID=UPI0018EFF39B
QHSSSLFTLRSGRIAWQEGRNEGHPWRAHRLILSCAVDTDTWTQEGTEQIRQRKANECTKVIAGTKAKENLNENQEAFIRKRERMLALLDSPFPRPNRLLYQGQPSILAAVSYGLDKPATLAIVDIRTGKAITYRSIRQLLGENYKLLNRYRLRQQRNAHERHNNQQKGAFNQLRESNAGKHLDRLIAHEILAIAQKHQVSSLVLPDLGNIREVIQSEIQARAEQKIPGSIEQQRQYALQYRANIHRWRYAQLSEFIQSRAAQIGISIEIVKQPLVGTPQEKAKDLAIAAYQSRK